jgi:hypothetical protein
VAECIRSAFLLSVQRTLAVASTHYDMNLERVSMGYVIAPGIEGDAAMAAMEEADAAALSKKIEDDLLPEAEDIAAENPQGEKATCRKSGPRSPCK